MFRARFFAGRHFKARYWRGDPATPPSPGGISRSRARIGQQLGRFRR